MIKSSEQGKEMVKKAMLSPRHGVHGPRKSTLIKEQVLREHFEKNLSVLKELGEEKISIARIKLSIKKPNSKMAEVKLKAIESVEDRVLGKPQTNNLNVNLELPKPIYAGSAN